MKVNLQNIMYLDATESLTCSRALMIVQTLAVNMDAESGNTFRSVVPPIDYFRYVVLSQVQ